MAELYKKGKKNDELGKKNPVLVASCPSSSVDFSEDFTKSTKFVWQDAAVNNPKKLENLCHPLDVKYSLVAQRFAFTAGAMPVVLINAEEKMLQECAQQLAAEQQPELRFYDSPEDIEIHGNEALALTLPIDALEKHPHVIEAEDHYRLLSKRDLAVSPLPTPYTKVLDIDVKPYDDAKTGFQKQTEYVAYAVQSHTPPFVVKFQQSLSGEGTFLVPDVKARDELVQHFTKDKVLKTLFAQVNEGNKHLLPASVILSEYVMGDSVQMHGLSFFVGRDGSVRFLCSGEQDMDESNHWAGAMMIYDNQEKLEKLLTPTMNEVGKYLYENGYFGPVGADILHDKEKDRFVVVDLNVRCSGSLILGALRRPFEEKGYKEAYLLTSIKFPCSKAELMEKFRMEFEEGRIVVVGWLERKDKDGDWGSLAVAGEDHETVTKLVGRLENLGIDGDAED